MGTFKKMLVVVAMLAALPVLAAPVADVSLGAFQVEWQPTGEFAGMTLRVSGPLGVVEREFPAGENPLFDLRTLEAVADGLYTWELVAAPRLDEGMRRAMTEARTAGDGAAEGRLRASGALPNAGDMVQSGSFRVAGGAIVEPSGEAEPRPTPRRVTSQAAGGDMRRVTAEDQVIPDDLIVQGSVCAGFDCINNESFGFDTIRLKENNTRIKFEDTSATAGFPASDWQLTANDSASGGRNKFSIEDITSATVPFTVTGGAPTNSVFVDSTGRVGFRTATPVLDLHVSTTNTPAIRLEQTNAGGFTAQTWDVAGNEANFFVRDVTGGSRLSFRIRPGAPTSSIDIAASGNVGIGTAGPTVPLHVVRSDGTAQFVVEERSTTEAARELAVYKNNGTTTFRFTDSNGTPDDAADDTHWLAGQRTNNTFIITPLGTIGAPRFSMDTAGNVTATSFTPSSRQLKEDFVAVDEREILERLESLPLATWRYKQDPASLHLGPTAEDFAAAFGLGKDNVTIGVADASGVALAAVKGLHQVVGEKEQQIDRLLAEKEEMERRLTALEAAVEALSSQR